MPPVVAGPAFAIRKPAVADPREHLTSFITRTDSLLGLLDGFMPEAAWLSDEETLTYLHSTVSTRRQRVRVPETPMYLDALLADCGLAGGLAPRLGDPRHLSRQDRRRQTVHPHPWLWMVDGRDRRAVIRRPRHSARRMSFRGPARGRGIN